MASSSSSCTCGGLLSSVDVDAVLEFWVGGNLRENYNNKWFPSGSKNIQQLTDAKIAATFSNLLQRALADEFILTQQATLHASLALIIILDQFSRHIFRHNNEPAESEGRKHADNRGKLLSNTKNIL